MKKTVFAKPSFTLLSLILFLLNFVWAPTNTPPLTSAQEESPAVRAAAMTPFLQNIGQIDDNVQFYANVENGTAFVEKDGSMTYNFRMSEIGGHVIKEKVLTHKTLSPEGQDPSKAKIQSFIGNKENWKSNIPAFQTIHIGEIYNGIELSLHTHHKSIEKLFKISPGASPATILMEIEGSDTISIRDDGSLRIKGEQNELTMSKPVAFQQTPEGTKLVKVAYNILNDHQYGFTVGDYNPKLPLFIDPVLAATYLGGSGVEGTAEVAVGIDSNNKAFIAAETTSTNFPTTVGAYDETDNAGNDIIISRFSNDLTTLEASTYIGSIQTDNVYALDIDDSDNIYITGSTTGGDYPTTGSAYDQTFNFNTDVFVSKLSNDLSTLSASTFIGGSAFEVAYDVGISPTSPQKVLVTGRTQSSDYPTVGSPFDSTLGGSQDAFVSKLDIDLTTLEASTYIGGNTSIGGPNSERGTEVNTDTSGNIYVAGYTNENDLPTTGGAYDGTFNLVDGFIGRFDSGLTSTGAVLSYLGGSSTDIIEDMEITSNGVYFSGFTTSGDYPTTGSAYSQTLDSGQDGFISRFSADLSTLQVSTFAGANGSEGARALSVDSNDNIIVGGETEATDFPTFSTCVTVDPGGFDAFLMNFSTDLSTLNNAAIIGGSGSDIGQDIAIDGSDNVFIGGYTTSTDFPATTGAYNESSAGSTDLFYAKFSDDLDTLGANQFCGTQVISASTLTFQDIPDTFSFGTITAGSTQELFNNETPPDANEPAVDDLLQIYDDRNTGGFTVTVDPDGVFDDENGIETIPLPNLYIVTSLDETDPGNNAGLTYEAGFSGDNNVSMPLYVDVDSVSLTDTATYTNLAPGSQFGGSPLTIMDGTLPSASGRDGTMSTFTNFYLHIDPTQEHGSFSLILTYTLADSTT